MADDQQFVCLFVFFPVGLFCVVFLLFLWLWLVGCFFFLPSLFSPEQFRVELKVLNLHFWVTGSIFRFPLVSLIVWWAFSLCRVRKCFVSKACAWGRIWDFFSPLPICLCARSNLYVMCMINVGSYQKSRWMTCKKLVGRNANYLDLKPF